MTYKLGGAASLFEKHWKLFIPNRCFIVCFKAPIHILLKGDLRKTVISVVSKTVKAKLLFDRLIIVSAEIA